MSTSDWMLVWSAILALSTVIMAIAIGFTAIYAAVQLRHLKRARRSSILMELAQAWDSDKNVEARKILSVYSEGIPFDKAAKDLASDVKILDKENADKFYTIVRVANFFENLGLLTCEGHLDRKDAMELFGSAAKRYWLLMKDVANYQRKEADKPQPDIWKYFEYLGNGCNKNDACLRIKASEFPGKKIT